MEQKSKSAFTRYEIFIIAILAFIQFTVILDFMVLSPLSAQLLQELDITTAQFSRVVSAYALSAGLAGLAAAGFADKFDRKKLLLFFYVGFIVGTLLCGIAPNYNFLLMARIVTGIFGGVIASVSFAIITDIFPLHLRGRVMGFVQMAFATSQVLGLPIALYLANNFGWHSPFQMIVGICVLAGIAIVVYMKPITAHLQSKSDSDPFVHLGKTVSNPNYLKAFGVTTLLATGGYMLMPFGSAFAVNNLGITLDDLPLLYLVTGLFTMFAGPLAGRFSDKIGKYKMFIMGTVLTMIMIGIYTNLGQTPFWLIAVLNTILFAGLMARMIPASALMTAVPEMKDRGAFMSINSSAQQISGGVAAFIAGLIVFQNENDMIENYNILGIVVILTMVITILLMKVIYQYVMQKEALEKGEQENTKTKKEIETIA